MKGLGLGTALVSRIYAMYTSMYFSWYLYYFINSFFNPLQWSTCGNSWNTPSCVESTLYGHAGMNTTVNGTVPLQDVNTTHWVHPNVSSGRFASASEEFWRYNALDISNGLDDTGSIRWPLFGCLTFTYVTMYVMLFKGIRVTGKIWIEACGYALHSMGTSTGIANTISSHNQRSSNCCRVAMVLCIVDPLITIFCGLSIFTVLGHMAHVTGSKMDNFQSSGLNLAFSVLPEAVTYLPLSQLWSVLVFMTMMTLGLDTTVPSLEITQETIADQFPSLAKRRWLLLPIVFLPCFLLALPYTTQAGVYVLTLVDWYASVPPVMLFGVVECIVLAWVFGVHRLDKCTEEMYGQRIPKWLAFLMKYITPGLLVIIFGYAFYEYRPPKYGTYFYPEWATAIGWLISAFMIVPTPC
ncbi:sodium- and chloride-dependent glycine transporter 2-like [Haliotis rubra]|uniref:sodium- and chloride-dependent glycine transporter 2-like n=1 Tax=Haliotis rubra TaxID=36100 RepID=UPI001EE5EDE9|nr:sodium- and chloride-dependent glycine transporter 2-like [Haliotis rubra]